MAIALPTLEFLFDSCRKHRLDLSTCKMIELGNQSLKERAQRYDGNVHPRIAKYFFQEMGVDHTSIDVNEKDGALPIDMCKPIEDLSLVGSFDILTNFGTSEHIENEYACWKNMHDLVKQGGLFVHAVPLVGNWYRHGLYKYTQEFFTSLCALCCYTEVLSSSWGRCKGRKLIFYSYSKDRDIEFVSREQFAILRGE